MTTTVGLELNPNLKYVPRWKFFFFLLIYVCTYVSMYIWRRNSHKNAAYPKVFTGKTWNLFICSSSFFPTWCVWVHLSAFNNKKTLQLFFRLLISLSADSGLAQSSSVFPQRRLYSRFNEKVPKQDGVETGRRTHVSRRRKRWCVLYSRTRANTQALEPFQSLISSPRWLRVGSCRWHFSCLRPEQPIPESCHCYCNTSHTALQATLHMWTCYTMWTPRSWEKLLHIH